MNLQRVGPLFLNNWVENESSIIYHADKSAVSSSSLRKIQKSPATFFFHHTQSVHEETDAMRLGTAFHCALLEPSKFHRLYVRLPEFGDLRSKNSREKRDEWKRCQEPGASFLTEDEFVTIEGMLNSVARHRDASALIREGKSEVSGYYSDPVTGIKCKIKPDFLNFNLMTLVDVKTTIDCSEEGFKRSIWNYRYDFQMAMYAEGIRLITGRSVNYAVFLVVEKDPPHECALYIADDQMLSQGANDYRAALDLLSDCLFKNQWPSYQQNLKPISLPAWAGKIF